MSSYEARFYVLLDKYNQLKETIAGDDVCFPVKDKQILGDLEYPDYERHYKKLLVEYHKLEVVFALSNYYLGVSKSNSYPLPSYPDIAQLALKTVELVDPDNLSKALPSQDFRDLGLLE